MQHQKLITILMILVSGTLVAQHPSFKQVDSTSYRLYEDQNWEVLAAFGKEAVKLGVDYYYLDLRTGIAFYQLGEYYAAEKYFEKALDFNPLSQIAQEYLYGIKLMTGRSLSADYHFRQLADSVQKRLSGRKPYYISSLYTETGLKISANKEEENNEPLVRFILSQKVTRGMDIGISGAYIGQYNSPWGEYSQLEAGITPSIGLTGNLSLLVGYRYIYNKTRFIVDRQTVYTRTRQIIYENQPAREITDSILKFRDRDHYLSNYHIVQGALQGDFRRLNITVGAIAYLGYTDADTKHDFETVKEIRIIRGNHVISEEIDSLGVHTIGEAPIPVDYYHAIAGVSYVLPVLKDGLVLRLSAYIPLNDDFSNTVWIPGLSVKITQRIWFYGEWMQKKAIPLLYENANIFLNQSYEVRSRITAGLSILQNDKLSWYITYLNEDKYYPIDKSENRFNTIVIGINVNF